MLGVFLGGSYPGTIVGRFVRNIVFGFGARSFPDAVAAGDAEWRDYHWDRCEVPKKIAPVIWGANLLIQLAMKTTASADSKKLVLYDLATQKWTDWVTEPGSVMLPAWSKDGKYVYYGNRSSENAGYRRVKLGEHRSELVVDLKDLSQLDPGWSGLDPNDTPLFVRNRSTDEIYALDLDLP